MIERVEREREMKKGIVSKFAVFGLAASLAVVALPGAAFAHVVVTPSEALTGDYETFTTSVPNEKEIPVTGLRVVIPDTIESVTPTVKPGWQIETKKSGEKTTEIIWTGGEIAPGLRDEFTFSAHLSDVAGDVNWKAYQTYQDGSVASWDQKPEEEGHSHGGEEGKGPYSTTVVSEEEATSSSQSGSSNTLLYVLSGAALIVSIFALLRTAKK